MTGSALSRVYNCVQFTEQSPQKVDHTLQQIQEVTALVLKETNMNTESLLEVATLGRQLHLGMLYDCHNDSFIPGVYLWDMDNIQKNKIVSQSPKTSFNIHLTDSLEEKSKILQISASLSASFLAGLVTVEASASYLNDRSSLHESRVTAQYSVRTKTEHLNMNQMGSITYKDIEDPDFSATHVVIQVEHRAEALMVFSESASDEQKKQDIQASMKLMVKNIGLFGISAEGKVQMTDEERKKVQNMICTFHGDFALEENPTNFEEAVKVYKNLPKLLGPNKENVVPKKVWLIPLTELVPSAPDIKHEVSKMNCIKLQNLMEQLSTAQMRANDISKESNSIRATDITKKTKDFGEKLQNYMFVWKDNLFKLIPEIRKGVEKEEKLEKMFKFHEDSPFGPSKMDAWLKDRETELSIVKSYINDIKSSQVPNLQIVAHEDYSKVLFNPKKKSVFAFVFNSLGEDDPYLESLRVCLDSEKFIKMELLPSDLQMSVKDKTPWYKSPEISQTMRESLEVFILNTEKGFFLPVISYFRYPYSPGASVRHYVEGRLLDVNVQNMSEPEVIDMNATSITMRRPSFALNRQISYKKEAIQGCLHHLFIQGDGGKAQEKMVPWPDGQEILVISGLLPNTKYEFQIGFGTYRHQTFTFVTKPN